MNAALKNRLDALEQRYLPQEMTVIHITTSEVDAHGNERVVSEETQIMPAPAQDLWIRFVTPPVPPAVPDL